MNRFIYIFIILWLIGCVGEDEFLDVAEIESKSYQAVSAINFAHGIEVDTPDYTYTAYTTGFPDYQFTIETFWKDKEWTTFLHLENYNKPVYDDYTYEWIEPQPTEIKASLYHNNKVHFAGTNGRLIWKYQDEFSIFPAVKSAGLEKWAKYQGGSIEDIIAIPGGYYLALNLAINQEINYQGNSAVVVKVPDVYTWPKRQWYVGFSNEITVHKLLMYQNRLVVFGKKDDQLFISNFNGNNASYYIIDPQFYYYDFPYKILGVIGQGDCFYVYGIDESGSATIQKFDNPYVSN